LLDDILLIAMVAVLSGAESWNDLADYGPAWLPSLRTFLALSSTYPRTAPLNQVISRLDPSLERGCLAPIPMLIFDRR
jgi:hypothetical protein